MCAEERMISIKDLASETCFTEVCVCVMCVQRVSNVCPMCVYRVFNSETCFTEGLVCSVSPMSLEDGV